MGPGQRDRRGAVSPPLAALIAVEALTFIVVGAVTQREPHVTALDVVISAGAIVCAAATVALARRYKARRVDAELASRTHTLELDEVQRRIGTIAPAYAQMDGPLAERLRGAALQRPSYSSRALRPARDEVTGADEERHRDEAVALVTSPETLHDAAPASPPRAPIVEEPTIAEPLKPEQTPAAPAREKEAAGPGARGGPARASEASPSGFASPSPGRSSVEESAADCQVMEAPRASGPSVEAVPATAPAPRLRRRRAERKNLRRRRRTAAPAALRSPDASRLTVVEPQRAEGGVPAEVVLRLELTRDDLVALLRILAQGSPEEARRVARLGRVVGGHDRRS